MFDTRFAYVSVQHHIAELGRSQAGESKDHLQPEREAVQLGSA